MDFMPTVAAIPAGDFIAIWKVLAVAVVLLCWARVLTWIDKDAKHVLLPRIPINLGTLGAGILAFFLFFMLPNFWVALLVLLMVIALSWGAYIGIRAQKAGIDDLGDELKTLIMPKRGPKAVKEMQGALQFIGKDGNLMAAPAEETPEAGYYAAIQNLLIDPLSKRADLLQFSPAEGGSKLVYSVDGVKYSGNAVDPQTAAGVVTMLKSVAGLSIDERRKPQKGKIKFSVNSTKQEMQIQTAGSSAGEMFLLQQEPKVKLGRRLEALGLIDSQEAAIRASIAEGAGICLITAPRGAGLTSTLYGILRAHDAFLTHIITVERAPEIELEGITQNAVPASPAPGEEAKAVRWVMDQEPDVVAISLVEDSTIARDVVRFAGGGEKRIYVCIRSSDSIDALTTWRKWVGDDEAAVKNLSLITNQRLIRKLCNACKVAYTPDPASLKKMNLNPDKVTELFQERTEPQVDQKGNPVPCPFCNDLRFEGRMGVFEVIPVTDDFRAAVQQGASPSQLRSVLRKQRVLTLQEAAFEAVRAGHTSVREVLRVFKAEPEKASQQAVAAR